MKVLRMILIGMVICTCVSLCGLLVLAFPTPEPELRTITVVSLEEHHTVTVRPPSGGNFYYVQTVEYGRLDVVRSLYDELEGKEGCIVHIEYQALYGRRITGRPECPPFGKH